mgnify:CR=1 FL=1
MRLERRQGVSLWLRLTLPVMAIAIALLLCSTLLLSHFSSFLRISIKPWKS